jgi:hypothetical protein
MGCSAPRCSNGASSADCSHRSLPGQKQKLSASRTKQYCAVVFSSEQRFTVVNYTQQLESFFKTVVDESKQL